jgi:uncharacterized membrane protein
LVLLLTLETIGLILAEFFIAYSIIGKNATISGLIEISYPLFIALFSFLIFREYSINTQTIIGGLLIFCGVIVIYYFNK